MEAGSSARRKPPRKNLSHKEAFVPEEESSYYLDDTARWQGDFIQEEHNRRAAQLKQKEDEALVQLQTFFSWLHSVAAEQEQLTKKREELLQAARAKQLREEQQFQEEQQRLAQLQQSGRKSKSNRSNVPFDILTLDYRATPKGAQLKQQDEERRQRVQLRSHRLYAKNNTTTHDIITGQPPRPFPDASAFSPV